MPTAMQTLLETLDLEPLEHNLFRGRSPQVGWQRVFGGQVVAQALVAAQRTVKPDRPVHSLHSYFLRPGDPGVPIIYEVDRIRDGGSFTTRRVVAIQHGEAIFSLSASFQTREDGLEHHLPAPLEVPHPEQLMGEAELINKFVQHLPESVKKYWLRERPIEMKPVSLTHFVSDEKLPPEQNVWFRAKGDVPGNPALQMAILAYFSDMTLLDTSLYAHGMSVFDPAIQAASLDHSMWFHRHNDLSDWLLYSQDSPNSSGGRGLSRGSIYTTKGELVASVAQEGLIRLRRRPRSG